MRWRASAGAGRRAAERRRLLAHELAELIAGLPLLRFMFAEPGGRHGFRVGVAGLGEEPLRNLAGREGFDHRERDDVRRGRQAELLGDGERRRAAGGAVVGVDHAQRLADAMLGLRADDEHGHRRALRDGVGNAAEEDVFQSREAGRADDDEIGVPLLRFDDDAFGRGVFGHDVHGLRGQRGGKQHAGLVEDRGAERGAGPLLHFFRRGGMADDEFGRREVEGRFIAIGLEPLAGLTHGGQRAGRPVDGEENFHDWNLEWRKGRKASAGDWAGTEAPVCGASLRSAPRIRRSPPILGY